VQERFGVVGVDVVEGVITGDRPGDAVDERSRQSLDERLVVDADPLQRAQQARLRHPRLCKRGPNPAGLLRCQQPASASARLT